MIPVFLVPNCFASQALTIFQFFVFQLIGGQPDTYSKDRLGFILLNSFFLFPPILTLLYLYSRDRSTIYLGSQSPVFLLSHSQRTAHDTFGIHFDPRLKVVYVLMEVVFFDFLSSPFFFFSHSPTPPLFLFAGRLFLWLSSL